MVMHFLVFIEKHGKKRFEVALSCGEEDDIRTSIFI